MITSIYPSSNETDIPVNASILVTFKDAMDTATFSGNISLSKVNGPAVPFSLNYNNLNKTLTVKPDAALEPISTYQFKMIGGDNGLASILGDTMSSDRFFTFTTTGTVQLSVPQNLTSSISNGYISLHWGVPETTDPTKENTYRMLITTTNDPSSIIDDTSAPVLWPTENGTNLTHSLSYDIPKHFEDGNYYASVRAENDSSQSEWATINFTISTPIVVTNPGSGGSGDTGSGSSGTSVFNVASTYPSDGSVNITPTKIFIQFSNNVDATTVDANSIYLIKGSLSRSLTPLDLLTQYSPAQSVQGLTPIISVSGASIVEMDIPDGTFSNDESYILIVRESVKSTDGVTLGVAHVSTFRTHLTYFYADVDFLESELSQYMTNIPAEYMNRKIEEISHFAFNVYSTTSYYTASDFQNDQVPFDVQQYVNYAVIYDLLIHVFTQSSNNSTNGLDITLADLTVNQSSSSGSSFDPTKILALYKSKLQLWEDALHGFHNAGYAHPDIVQRGSAVETYPDFFTRDAYNDLS